MSRSIYTTARLFISGLFVLLSFSSFANPFPVEKLHSIGDSQYHLVSIKNPKQDYHLFVHLPKSYSKEADTKYPVIYLLDGGFSFPMLASYYRLINLVDDAPEVILVGISYGTSDWKKGNARSRDFTSPSNIDDRKHWGGAERFSQTLNEDVFPLIERNYRADEKRRIVFGNSLGGQFGIYLAQFQPELVYGVIASNPSIHANVEFYLTEAPPKNTAHHTRLFIAQGELDGERYVIPRNRWLKHWKANPNPNWALRVQTLQGHTHVSGMHEAFRQGLIWVLK